MSNLLKLEFRRYLKDKSTLIALIISVAVTLLIVLLFNAFPDGFLNGLFIFNYLSSSSSYIVYLVIIIGLIIAVKDYNHGTLRAKIVAGYNRTQVYFSSYIVFLCFGLAITFISSLLGLGLGTLALKNEGIKFADFVSSIGLSVIWMIFTYTFVFFLVSAFKGVGAPLGITLGTLVVFSMFGTIIPTLAEVSENVENLNKVLFILPFYQMGSKLSILTLASSSFSEDALFSNGELLTIIISTVTFTVGFAALGYLFYSKTDLR
jgi:ABC-type transport system involved in multi-copper enzyme maturation permease subunit